MIHCSATPITMDIGVKTITKWHKNKGWNDCGYHYIIRLDGTLEEARPIEKAGAHAYGFNQQSLGVCVVGGCDKDLNPLKTINPKQEKTLIDLIVKLDWKHLNLNIKGHNELSNKDCPSFNVQDWLKGYKKV